MNLRWSDIDLNAGLTHIGITKNGKPITLPLTGIVLADIRQHSAVRRINCNLLFPAPTNHNKVYGNFRLHGIKQRKKQRKKQKSKRIQYRHER